MMYTGVIVGRFRETQSVEAGSMEEAKERLSANEGETLERTALDVLEVTEIEEVEEEVI